MELSGVTRKKMQICLIFLLCPLILKLRPIYLLEQSLFIMSWKPLILEYHCEFKKAKY